ncbi:MAG: PqqD family protein [Lachnospiraceae bacterium]|nr:PqqD family protein [Lachnospiraceae bacterium]
MKSNPAFSLQSIGDVYLLVPLHNEIFQKENIIPTNEVGALLWKNLQEECTEEKLSRMVSAEYDIAEKDALKDIRLFLKKLKKAGALLDASSYE